MQTLPPFYPQNEKCNGRAKVGTFLYVSIEVEVFGDALSFPCFNMNLSLFDGAGTSTFLPAHQQVGTC